VPATIWDAKPGCRHRWRGYRQPAANGSYEGMHGWTKQDKTATRVPRTQTLCALCGAWRGQLGLEPTPKMYVRHLVQVFREIHYYDHKANEEPASDSERRRRERERERGKAAMYKLKRDEFANPPGATSCLRNLDKRTELAISGVRRRRSVWQIAVTPYTGDHSSMFPLRIAEVCIAAGCPEGGVVLDPFCGMATVGVMALRMGRKFVGIEAAHKTCLSARERIRNDAPMFNTREVSRLEVESAQAALFA
jgi:DNA methylase